MWPTHPSVSPPAEYCADLRRVMKGRCVMAWLAPARGGFRVVTPNGRTVGVASTPAEALMMVVRDEEAPR